MFHHEIDDLPQPALQTAKRRVDFRGRGGVFFDHVDKFIVEGLKPLTYFLPLFFFRLPVISVQLVSLVLAVQKIGEKQTQRPVIKQQLPEDVNGVRRSRSIAAFAARCGSTYYGEGK